MVPQEPERYDEELLSALMERIKGPDFPTGATILGTKGIEDAYRTGRGSITHARGRQCRRDPRAHLPCGDRAA